MSWKALWLVFAIYSTERISFAFFGKLIQTIYMGRFSLYRNLWSKFFIFSKKAFTLSTSTAIFQSIKCLLNKTCSLWILINDSLFLVSCCLLTCIYILAALRNTDPHFTQTKNMVDCVGKMLLENWIHLLYTVH